MGTVTAPAVMIAKSHSAHSYRVPDISATRSPGPIPAATRPAASVPTWPANCAAGTVRQAPSTLRANAACAGRRRALSNTSSAAFASSGTTYSAGVTHSRPAPLSMPQA